MQRSRHYQTRRRLHKILMQLLPINYNKEFQIHYLDSKVKDLILHKLEQHLLI